MLQYVSSYRSLLTSDHVPPKLLNSTIAAVYILSQIVYLLPSRRSSVVRQHLSRYSQSDLYGIHDEAAVAAREISSQCPVEEYRAQWRQSCLSIDLGPACYKLEALTLQLRLLEVRR
jgi:hypothetical protein